MSVSGGCGSGMQFEANSAFLRSSRSSVQSGAVSDPAFETVANDSGLQRVLIPNAVKTAKGIDLGFVYRVDDFAGQEFRFPQFGHFASRRNNSACSAEVLRISFRAFSMDMVRTGGTSCEEAERAGTSDIGCVLAVAGRELAGHPGS